MTADNYHVPLANLIRFHMKNPLLHLSLAALCAVSSVSAVAQASSDVTVGQYVTQMQLDTLGTVTSYCSGKVPDFSAAASQYKSKVDEAAAPMIAAHADELSKPVTPEMRAQGQQFSAKLAAGIGQIDPRLACPVLVNKLQGASVESVRKNMEKALALLQAKSGGQGRPAGQ